MAQQQILKIIWTKTAQIQFLSVLEYWTNRNKSTTYSEKITIQVWDKIEILTTEPLSSIQSDFPNTRQAILGHFCLFYQIKSSDLITAFWDNRQDPRKILDILLKS